MIQGNIRFFRGTKQMQHTSHQEYSDSELEWSNLVLQFCLILPKNTGAYDTHAPIFYTYSVSNIFSDEVNYYFPAKRLRKIRCSKYACADFLKKIVLLISSTLSIKLIFSPLSSYHIFKSIKCCFKL